ncbi:MAG: hypothetical protein GX591_20035, partial [Planctomycetes bacterium]|nr:hypothetical protein [Planctomycetota bacterium]
SLGGTWSVLVGHGDAAIWRPDVAAAAGPWKPVEVPSGNLVLPDSDGDGAWQAVGELHERTGCVWVRRTFDLDPVRAGRDAVLRWGGIRFGASAWINGRPVTRHVPIGPHAAVLPQELLKAGSNEIVLRVTGWAGVPRSASGYPLLPVGGSTQSWGGKGPGIYADLWLEFYDDVYAKWVLAMPDVAAGAVTLRVWLDGSRPVAEDVALEAIVREPGGHAVLARATATAPAGTGSAAPVDIVCRLADVKAWTPRTPHLYEAEIVTRLGPAVCDRVRFTFGMREVTVKDGRFSLNGLPLWLRGSNLVNEWLWGDRYNDNVVDYLIAEARAMNLNCFRTHTQPPPAAWLDVADAHGMMILAEMPLLYNHADFGYTPEEYDVLHRNAMLDLTGWITRMWNHPSIILWVLSNESRHDNAWESGPYYRCAKALDPTRLCMRTGEHVVGTPDMADIHTCFNVVRDAEGQLLLDMARLAEHKDPTRPLTNTEYMNRMWDPSGRWLRRANHPDYPLYYAECATEHTEAMRRLRIDCLLPYMYAGWTRLRGAMDWRDDYPTPMAAALHSSMAPVLASLEMFDRNYPAGGRVPTHLTLINETHDLVEAVVTLYVTAENPLFVPDAGALEAAVWTDAFAVTLGPDSLQRLPVRVAIPAAEGSYYLAAVLTREGDSPVVSQRVIHAVDAAASVAGLSGRRVALLGGDEAIRRWLADNGCRIVEPAAATIDADVVLVWDAAALSDEQRALAPALRTFASGGRRVVVANQTAWTWTDLVDCRIGLPSPANRNPVICSRAHAYEGASHPLLDGIPADWLWRWNGLPGAIANETLLDGAALAAGRKILWASRDVYPMVLSVPVGRGEILMNQLHIRGRISPAADACDPVAERMLANLLTR